MLKKNKKFSALRSLALAGAMGACSAGPTQGAILVTYGDSTGNLVVTWSGSIDVSGANVADSLGAGTHEIDDYWVYGHTLRSTQDTDDIYGFNGITPTLFTEAVNLTASSSSGDSFGIGNFNTISNLYIYIPAGYTGQQIDGSMTFNGVTAASVGLVDQTITWGAGGSQREITITTVPEPSSTALLGLGGLALMLRRRR